MVTQTSPQTIYITSCYQQIESYWQFYVDKWRKHGLYTIRQREQTFWFVRKKGRWGDTTPEPLSCNKNVRDSGNWYSAFYRDKRFSKLWLEQYWLPVEAPVNVYLANSHCFTILCCLDESISTQMFTVFDLCPLFLAVNQQSIMKPFIWRTPPTPLPRPLFERPSVLTSWNIREGSVGASWCQHSGSSKCRADVLNMPCRDVHRDVLCRIEIPLPALPCHRLSRNVMNVPSCYRHKCSHRLLQHVGHHPTQMCHDDGSSFFSLISLFFSPFLNMPRTFGQTG